MEHKIIFTGPVGAGKTTAINTISDIATVRTEAKATDETRLRKTNTTVAMDFGALELGDGMKVMLYGTPGQERFNYMWDILAQGSIGLVLLLDNVREDPLADMEFFLKAFRPHIDASAIVIGVTRMDEKARPGLYTYCTRLHQLGLNIPVLEVDARRRDHLKIVMHTLLAVLDPELHRHHAQVKAH